VAFRGRVALVTGAARGLGRLAARRLAASGVGVVAVDVDEPGLVETARHAPNVETHLLDVTDAAAIEATVRDVEARLGPVDRLVHAAAIAPAGRLADQPAELVRRAMTVNYGGTVNTVFAVVPSMLERNRGDLVLFGSLAGWMPTPGLGAYTASKFAVVGLAEVLAMELGQSSLRLCCACPALVDTPMVDEIDRDLPVTGQPRLAPEIVLDSIERGLELGEHFVFPGPTAAVAVRARRFVPGLVRRRLTSVLGGARPGDLLASHQPHQ